jgi:hypothetical protein
MKLTEIKPVVEKDYELTEGVIPVHITMTLEQIVRDHKITNPVQYFVMGALVEMFKNGGPTRWPRDLNAYSMTTSAELIDTLKGLTEADHVGMAVWLLNELQRPVNFETNPYAVHCNPQMGPLEWMRFVLQRQA